MESVSRKQFLKNLSIITGGLFLNTTKTLSDIKSLIYNHNILASNFGKDFVWGAASAAFQSEGAWDIDGKTPSIWDTFTERKGKIRNNDDARVSCDFFNRYMEDITLLKSMNFNAFRFSLSWPRILPYGTGSINQKGVDFYNRVIDYCLELEITPWLTIYHWDLPQKLQDKGGWVNRDVVGWFSEYTEKVTQAFGDRVKHWIVLNEPLAFTGFGYLMGTHAPGKKGLKNFYPAVHHAALCQSVGAAIVKNNVRNANVGTSFSCSPVDPVDQRVKSIEAAKRLDAAINRIFIEPAMGLGYPTDTLPLLKNIENHFKPGDDELLKGDFDFIGLQYYFRLVAKHSIVPPLFANQIEPLKRNVPVNSMNLEVYPSGIQIMLERFSSYQNIKKIVVTESGVCFKDILNPDNSINDYQRISYFQETLKYVLHAKNKGIPVEGYFAWSITDNFEWVEGYNPRFGLIYIDYPTQKRIIKDSGKWFNNFLDSDNK